MGYCHCPRPDLWDTGESYCCISCGLTASLETKPSPGREAGDPKFVCNDNNQTAPPFSSTATFSYKKLARASEFRLLRLSPGSHEDEIMGEVFHADISDPPDYEAVSYTWGDTTLAQEISTKTGPIKITTNCLSALKALRRVTSERVLWIDAICIAQADDLEKNHQIPLMPRIYAKATLVLIYLGHHASLKNTKALCALLRKGGKAPLQPTHGRQIATFLSLPWFSRIWVLQEVAMARRAEVVVGPVALNWRHLSIANIAAVGLKPTDLEGHIPAVLQFSGNDKKPIKDIASLISKARSCLSSDPRDRIYALLGLVDERAGIDLTPDYTKTTRDIYTDVAVQYLKVYNCLDLLSDIGKYEMPPKVTIDPTTMIHPRDLEVRRSFLDKLQKDLFQIIKSLLGYPGGHNVQRLLRNLSSTVKRETRLLFSDLQVKPNDDIATAIRTCHYILTDFEKEMERLCSHDTDATWTEDAIKACCSWRLKLGSAKQELSLLESKTVTAIMQKQETFFTPEYLFGAMPAKKENMEIIDEELELPSWVPDYRQHPQLSTLTRWRPDHFAGRLVARFHAYYQEHPVPSLEVRAIFLSTVRSFDCGEWNSIQLCHKKVSFMEILWHKSIDFVQEFENDLFKINHGATLDDIREFSRGRKLALTETSFAIVPANVQHGDVIAFIFGGTVPYLLRRSDSGADRLHVIGECYLHGVKGAKFAPDYRELLGSFRNHVMLQGWHDGLPWRRIFLE